MPAESQSGELDEAKLRVRAQYGSVGDAYVRSAGHASGKDLDRMVELSGARPTDRLLDIATGGGHVARSFAPLVASVVASDLTPEILYHADTSFAEHGLTNVTTEIGDAESLPFPNASFEIVTCRIAPHHFPHPEQFVAEVARVLTPGGRFLLIDTTVPHGAAGDFTNQIDKLRDPSHVRALTIAGWEALISNAGLTLSHVESFTKRHDFADWTTRSRMRDANRDALAGLMAEASEEIRATLKMEFIDGNIAAFSDTKTLFIAVK
jgi:ubiquinone/menaquinone biosynthesis C-methylase UbiE